MLLSQFLPVKPETKIQCLESSQVGASHVKLLVSAKLKPNTHPPPHFQRRSETLLQLNVVNCQVRSKKAAVPA